MTDDYIRKLDGPKAADFDPKTYAALAYAHQWALTRGKVSDRETVTELEKHYSAEERSAIEAIIKAIDCSNRFFNLIFGPMDRKKVFKTA